MNTFLKSIVAPAGLLSLVVPLAGHADDGHRSGTPLSGFAEIVGPNLGLGALFSTGSGRFSLKVDKERREIHFKLTYDFPDAAATPVAGAQFVNQAHLHFGQKHTTGGINVWLCQSDDSPAPAAA